MSEATAQVSDAQLVGVSIDRHFELDAEIAKIQGSHKAELEPLFEELKLVDTFVKGFMAENNEQQRKNTNGNQCFFQTKDSVSAPDFEQTLDYIVAAPAPEGYAAELWASILAHIRKYGNWNLLNKAVNKTAVKEYVEVNKVPPPGIKYDAFRDLQWRRGKG